MNSGIDPDRDRQARHDFATIVKPSDDAKDCDWWLEQYAGHPLEIRVRARRKWLNSWFCTLCRSLDRLRVIVLTSLAAGAALLAIINAEQIKARWAGETQLEEAGEGQYVMAEGADRSSVLPVPRAGSDTGTALALPPGDPDYLKDFQALLDDQGVRTMRAEDVLFAGARANTRRSCTNTLPPREQWDNIVPTLMMLELLRSKFDARVTLLSVYRSPGYNQCIGGVKDSTHTRFRAADFVLDVGTPVDWAAALNGIRDDNFFAGGIGLEPQFVHLDTRGLNTTWRGTAVPESDFMRAFGGKP